MRALKLKEAVRAVRLECDQEARKEKSVQASYDLAKGEYIFLFLCLFRTSLFFTLTVDLSADSNDVVLDLRDNLMKAF